MAKQHTRELIWQPQKIYVPQHGELDKATKKVYCNYWMTLEEWNDIHNYSIIENQEQKIKQQNTD